MKESYRNENDVYKPLHEPVLVSHSRAPLASVESAQSTKAMTAAATITTTSTAAGAATTSK